MIDGEQFAITLCEKFFQKDNKPYNQYAYGDKWEAFLKTQGKDNIKKAYQNLNGKEFSEFKTFCSNTNVETRNLFMKSLEDFFKKNNSSGKQTKSESSSISNQQPSFVSQIISNVSKSKLSFENDSKKNLKNVGMAAIVSSVLFALYNFAIYVVTQITTGLETVATGGSAFGIVRGSNIAVEWAWNYVYEKLPPDVQKRLDSGEEVEYEDWICCGVETDFDDGVVDIYLVHEKKVILIMMSKKMMGKQRRKTAVVLEQVAILNYLAPDLTLENTYYADVTTKSKMGFYELIKAALFTVLYFLSSIYFSAKA